MKWFKHYSEASQDLALQIIESQYGHFGYASYFRLLEYCCRSWTGFDEPIFEITRRELSFVLRTKGKRVDDILRALSDQSLIITVIFQDHFRVEIPNMKKIKDNTSAKTYDSRGLTRATKELVFERDKKRCVYCDTAVTSLNIAFDHFIPVSKGGSNEAHNIVLSCENCNQSKSSKMPDIFAEDMPHYKDNISLIYTRYEAEENKNKNKNKKNKTIEKPKKEIDEGLELRKKIWADYDRAIARRYGKSPIRNQKINSLIKQLAQRIGSDAPDLVKFYVSLNDNFLEKNLHAINLLVVQCEKIHLQMQTGKTITGSGNKTFSQQKTEANKQAYNEIEDLLRARK